MDDPKANPWIGIEDIDTEGTFVYHTSKTQIKFSHWSNNQPNNLKRDGPEGENCANINYNVADG